jgi:hypothetical protein
LFFKPLKTLFYEKEIVQLQFLVKKLNITTGVHRAMDMKDGVVLKRSNKMADDVHLLQPPQNLIIPRGLLVQVREKKEFNLGRGFLARSVNLHEPVEPHITYLRQAQNIPFLAFRIWLFPGQQPKECPLSDLRKTYKTQFHSIPLFPAGC